MLTISESAQDHFRRLIEQQEMDGLGVRMHVVQAGSALAERYDQESSRWLTPFAVLSTLLTPHTSPFASALSSPSAPSSKSSP